MIPKIIHRSVPATTSPEVEAFWSTTVDLHHGWKCVTWRDPLDPSAFPLTSPHWHRVTSGAQLAGLVRLELLYTHGGVWLDSDVELYRNLTPLLACRAFAGYEDERVIPDAVLGAEPGHPAIKACLDLAIQRINSDLNDWRFGRGAWATGPGVTTTVLAGRDDVLLLPPGSFYPLHYANKTGAHWATVREQNPWAFGAHRWHASWL